MKNGKEEGFIDGVSERCFVFILRINYSIL